MPKNAYTICKNELSVVIPAKSARNRRQKGGFEEVAVKMPRAEFDVPVLPMAAEASAPPRDAGAGSRPIDRS